MKIKEIAFVCYPVKSLKKAQVFYEEVLGLKPTSTWIQSDESGFIEYDTAVGTLAIGAGAEHFKPGKSGPGVALEVEDFDAAMSELTAAAVPLLLDTQDFPSCRMAIVEDPDGNQITIHQRKG